MMSKLFFSAAYQIAATGADNQFKTAMEADTKKHGRSSTSQKGRGNQKHSCNVAILNILIAAMLMSATIIGCEDSGSANIKMTTEQTSISFYLNGTGTATVDWGDGSENITLTLDDGVRFRHGYENASIRVIRIKGDNITSLSCREEYITSLDVSRSKLLTSLDVVGNHLTSLDVSKNKALKELKVGQNRLTSINARGAVSLTHLDASRNELASLDIRGANALEELVLYKNQLTSLDVSGAKALEKLDVSSNQLTSLDVSGANSLVELYVAENQLTNLDVNGANALVKLVSNGNQLTSLDVSGVNSLVELKVARNQLTNLDIGNNSEIVNLDVSNNQLTNLDIGNITELTILDLTNNQLSTDALNTIFNSLPKRENSIRNIAGMRYFVSVGIFGNPGTNYCDQSIAFNKGWSVIVR